MDRFFGGDPDSSLVETASMCGLTKYKMAETVIFQGRSDSRAFHCLSSASFCVLAFNKK